MTKKGGDFSWDKSKGNSEVTCGSKSVTLHVAKKQKKENGVARATNVSSTELASINPMERKKKRKAVDKGRQKDVSDTSEYSHLQELHVSKTRQEIVPMETSPRSVLPEFHVDVFQELASANVSIRESAAETMVEELYQIQKAYGKLKEKNQIGNETCFEHGKDDCMNNCAPSLRYALRRLVSGLSSSRVCARQGFALGLTLLVGRIRSIKVEKLLKLIADTLEISSSMKGQDARDCLLGRLFSYGALVRSKRLTEKHKSEKNISCLNSLVSFVISLAKKKQYFQEPCVTVILELVEQLSSEALFRQVAEASVVQEWFEGAVEGKNPDALLLALKLQDKTSIHFNYGKLLPRPYDVAKFFSPDHLTPLADCLKESIFCRPRIHGVWYALINALLPEESTIQEDDFISDMNSIKRKKSQKLSDSSLSGEVIASNLHSFFDIIIEGSLLMSSHDCKHLAFDVLLLIIPRLPAYLIPVVFSAKLTQCLVDVLSNKKSWLFKAAQHFLEKVLESVECDEEKRVAVIISLQRHSNGNFDCITRTKTVNGLMAGFKTESGCKFFIQKLSKLFIDGSHSSRELPSDQSQTTDDNSSEIGSGEDNDTPESARSSDFLKSWVIQSLSYVIKIPRVDSESILRLKREILKFLAVQGLFCASLGREVTSFELQEKFRWPKTETPGSLRRFCVQQLQSLIVNVQKGEGHIGASGFHSDDIGSYFMQFFRILRSIPSVSLFQSLSGEDENTFEKLIEMENKLCKEERNCGLDTDAKKLRSLRYLLIQLVLQVLLKPGEFSAAAMEIVLCCQKVSTVHDLLDSSEEDELYADEAPDLMDVLVETLLSLLPQSSAPLRSAVEQVFRHFCKNVTDDGLLRMLQVIKKGLNPKRQRGGEDDEDGGEDFFTIEESREDGDEAESVENGESDDQTDAEVGDEEDSMEIDRKDSNDSDMDMDDEAMFRLDSYLSQIFKDRKNVSGSESAQSQLVIFKLRVLSLLEIYLQKNPGKPQVLMVFSGLLQAYTSPHITESGEQLGERILGIMQRKILKAKEYPKGEGVEISSLESLLERGINMASKPFKKNRNSNNNINPCGKKHSISLNRHRVIASLARSSVLWVLKMIQAPGYHDSKLDKVYAILESTVVSYFDQKKCQLKCDFLKSIFRNWQSCGRRFLPLFLDKCVSARFEYRRVEGLDLVAEVMGSMCRTGGVDVKREVKKVHLPKLCLLLKELVSKPAGNAVRRAGVRKFCRKMFRILFRLGLTKAVAKRLDSDTYEACRTQLG